jgi:hypothetical protein
LRSMDNLCGTAPVNTASHGRLDEIGRQVSVGSLLGVAGVALAGLVAAGVDRAMPSSRPEAEPAAITKSEPSAEALQLPPLPNLDSAKP